MDKQQREDIKQKARLILGEVGMDMAQSYLVEHNNRKYDVMIRDLSEKLQAVEDLEGKLAGKGFFAKLGDKINGVSPEERKIDEILTDCARAVRRLQNCHGCLCIDCIRDECQYNCSFCPDGGCVIDCPGDGQGFCMRKTVQWTVTLHGFNGRSTHYEVLAMLSDLTENKSYVVLKGRTNDIRRVMNYSRRNGAMTDVETDAEYDKVMDIVAKMIGY